MNAQHNIEYLINIIKELSNKIDNLENKIDNLYQQVQKGNTNIIKNNTVMVVPNFVPSIGFQPWLQKLNIDKQDIEILLGTNILDGFKCYLIKYISVNKNNKESIPIYISSNGRYKQIYIYDSIDSLRLDAKWYIMTDDDVCLLIDIIWRKIIEYYFVTEEESIIDMLSEDEQTQRDMNKKNLLDMKKRLHRHTREIQRSIITSMER